MEIEPNWTNKGEKGSQGEQGDKGEKGDQGDGIKINYYAKIMMKFTIVIFHIIMEILFLLKILMN